MVVLEEKAEPSLKDLWDDAEKKFQKITKKSLKASSQKKLDDVLRELECKYAEKDSDEESYKRQAKAMIQNVLTCIKILGGIAAQGASVVFGPADLCFNAVSFLIDIPARINKVYEGLAELFEQISAFLGRFRIYQRIEQFSSIDAELYDTTHRLMISFVNICSLSIDLLGGGTWKQITTGAKAVLFQDDSGVQKELDNFKSLVQRQSAVTETVTLEHVLKTEKQLTQLLTVACESGSKLTSIEEGVVNLGEGVGVLVAAENDRKLQKITEEHVYEIEKKLFRKGEARKESEKTFNENRSDSVRNSGSWLHDVSEYEKWIDPESDVDPLLLVSGGDKSGKSYLTSAVVNEIQSNLGDGDKGSTRKSVAYYFFPKRTDKSGIGSSNDQQLAATALKCMAVQIAVQNKGYAKDLATLCKSKEELYFKDSSCKELWNFLKFSSPGRDVTCFLLFDGLDQLSDENAGQLLEVLGTLRPPTQSARPQLRVFASGTPRTFQKESLVSVPTIDIAQYNQSDIEAYIDRVLKENDSLQGLDVETVQLTKSIRTRLPEVARGNFFSIQHTLERIRQAVSADESSDVIEKILDDAAHQDQDEMARQVINNTNEILNAQEIDQLNELLMWAIYGYEYFTVDQLRAALFLRFSKTPLQPLEKKLKGKYSRIFYFDMFGRVTVADEIESLLRNSPSSRGKKEGSADDDTPKITATITITRADISMVQRFLWSLSERAIFDKFGFNEFATKIENKGSISVNLIDAQLNMTKQCLKLLNAEPDEKTKPLVSYALVYLTAHLASVKSEADLGNIESSDKKEIGKDLVTLLSDVDAIEKHWTPSSGMIFSWLDPHGGVAAFHAWLTDSEAMDQLGKSDKRWVRQATWDSKEKGGFLKPMTRMVARHWLKDREWNVSEAYNWVDSFVSLQEAKDDVDSEQSDGRNEDNKSGNVVNVEKSEEGSEPDIAVVQSISLAAEWAQEALGVKEPDSLWFERLGQTYLESGECDSALNAYQRARNLPGSHWRSIEGTALAYAGKQMLSPAANEMERVLETLRNKDGRTLEEQADFLQNIQRLADWRNDLRQPEIAIILYDEALKIDPDDYSIRRNMLKALISAGQEERARDMLNQMSSQRAKKGNLSQLAEMLRHFVSLDERHKYFELVFSTMHRSDIFAIILEAMQRAIEFARGENMTVELATLLLHHGVALAHYGMGEKRIESALDLWEECCIVCSQCAAVGMVMDSHELAVRYIGTYHFRQAMTAKQNGQSPNIHVERLERLVNSIHDFRSVTTNARSFLGSFYTLSGERQKARELFLNDIRDAFSYLSDDYPENDYQGYYLFADVLMHYGDYLNALSAWSLLGPRERFPQEVGGPKAAAVNGETLANRVDSVPKMGDLCNSCDGGCDKQWTFADNMWCCKFCHDVQFDDRCLKLLQEGKLERYICSPDHDWLHVPAWSDKEYGEIGERRVKIGGELVDGKRVGGRVVEVSEWLDILRDEWGIPKPEKMADE